MLDLTQFNASLDALTAQVTKTETVEAGASELIAGFSAAVAKAVTAALTADNAADQGSIDAANAAIADVTTRYQASSEKLGAAIVANTPSA